MKTLIENIIKFRETSAEKGHNIKIYISQRKTPAMLDDLVFVSDELVAVKEARDIAYYRLCDITRVAIDRESQFLSEPRPKRGKSK